MWAWTHEGYKGQRSRRVWKVPPQRVIVPYATRSTPSFRYQSSTELVELRVKLGGPPPKAKYSLATDSVEVRRLKGEKNPFKGRDKNLKPCTYKLSEPYGHLRVTTGDGVPFAEWTGELLCMARLSP